MIKWKTSHGVNPSTSSLLQSSRKRSLRSMENSEGSRGVQACKGGRGATDCWFECQLEPRNKEVISTLFDWCQVLKLSTAIASLIACFQKTSSSVPSFPPFYPKWDRLLSPDETMRAGIWQTIFVSAFGGKKTQFPYSYWGFQKEDHLSDNYMTVIITFLSQLCHWAIQ